MRISPLSGKTTVVTGAGAGIGRALAVELSRRGARVACADINRAGLDETVDLCGGDAESFLVDVSDRAAVEDFAEAVVDRFGDVHQIYNNAGIALNPKCSTARGMITIAFYVSTSTVSFTERRHSCPISSPPATATWSTCPA